jgi:hypothetical protein
MIQATTHTDTTTKLKNGGIASNLIGLKDLTARLRAMNLAKLLNVSKKTISIIPHLCSKMAVFGQNSFRWVHPGSLIGLIQQEDCTVSKSTYLRSQTADLNSVHLSCTVENLGNF